MYVRVRVSMIGEGPTEKGKRISDIAARRNRQWNRHCEGLGYGVDV